MLAPIYEDYWKPAPKWVHPKDAGYWVGKRCRMLRIEAEIGMLEMARRLGCGRAKIRRFETGQCDPSLGLLVCIARVLSLDLVDLLWDLRFDPPERYVRASYQPDDSSRNLRTAGDRNETQRAPWRPKEGGAAQQEKRAKAAKASARNTQCSGRMAARRHLKAGR